MNFDLLPPRHQLVHIMNRIYYGGMTTLSGGNLSILDEEGTVWITPAGVDKGKLTPNDIVCVGPDGTTEGLHRPSSELPFHLAIYARRPDIRAIVHAHAPALVAFSIVRKLPDTSLIPQAQRVCGHVGYAPYALPGSEMLGERIAEAFADGFDSVLLENHGVATAGASLLEAFQRLETLNFCARTQMYAQGLGPTQGLNTAQIKQFVHRDNVLTEFTHTRPSSRERELRAQIVDVVQRACQRQLMISTEGVASVRLDAPDADGAFLITPTGYDRPSISHEDVVLIRSGRREAGKLPSRSVRLHEAIYRRHPDINCIITTQSPYATAYAVADTMMDTRTIPESYIMLLGVPKLPYGPQFSQPDEVARMISAKSPVLLLQNDCVLTTGKHIMQAFDRLEVAEFTARSLIETASIGELVAIGSDELAELEQKFLA